ncbi:hypothetical protein VTN96DRAFT_5994 [Rasamsonia emersonii]
MVLRLRPRPEYDSHFACQRFAERAYDLPASSGPSHWTEQSPNLDNGKGHVFAWCRGSEEIIQERLPSLILPSEDSRVQSKRVMKERELVLSCNDR